MPSAWQDINQGVQEADDGYRTNLVGETTEAGGMPGVCIGGHGGVAFDAPSEPARHGSGGMGRDPPQGRPKLTGYLSQNVCCGSGAQ